MTILGILTAVFFFIPVAVLIWNLHCLWKLNRARTHDILLYRFCRVRDEMALAALDGEIKEDSATFQFFFCMPAGFVHHQEAAGHCFHKMIRFVAGKVDQRRLARSETTDTAISDGIAEELAAAPKRVQRIANDFCNTIKIALLQSYHLILLDRLIRRIARPFNTLALVALLASLRQ